MSIEFLYIKDGEIRRRNVTPEMIKILSVNNLLVLPIEADGCDEVIIKIDDRIEIVARRKS